MPRERAIGKPATRRYSSEEKAAAVRMVRTVRSELTAGGAPEHVQIGRDQTGRLMRAAGIEGTRRSKRVETARPDPTSAWHADLVRREFTVTAPNRLWVTILTFVPTWAGVAYVCFIIDAFSRMIVGWRVASRMRMRMRTEMVLDAIEMARCELIHGSARSGPWRSVEDLELATLGWVRRHNTQHLHGYLGDSPPVPARLQIGCHDVGHGDRQLAALLLTPHMGEDGPALRHQRPTHAVSDAAGRARDKRDRPAEGHSDASTRRDHLGTCSSSTSRASRAPRTSSKAMGRMPGRPEVFAASRSCSTIVPAE